MDKEKNYKDKEMSTFTKTILGIGMASLFFCFLLTIIAFFV